MPSRAFDDPAELVVDQPETGHSASPELLLMAAVLAEAIDDFRRFAGDDRPWARRLFGEVHQWFTSPERRWPCSFEHICAALDFDADTVRRLVLLEAHRTGDEPDRAHFRRTNGSRVRQVVLRPPSRSRPEKPVA